MLFYDILYRIGVFFIVICVSAFANPLLRDDNFSDETGIQTRAKRSGPIGTSVALVIDGLMDHGVLQQTKKACENWLRKIIYASNNGNDPNCPNLLTSSGYHEWCSC